MDEATKKCNHPGCKNRIPLNRKYCSRKCVSSDIMTKLHKDPKFAARRDKQFKEMRAQLLQNEEYLTKMQQVRSQVMIALNQDPEFAARRDERASKTFKRLHKESPEMIAHRQRQIRIARQTFIGNPNSIELATKNRTATIRKRLEEDLTFRKEWSNRASKHMTKLHQDPKFTARRDQQLQELNQKLWNDPEYEEFRQRKAKEIKETTELINRDPIWKALILKKLSCSLKKTYNDPEKLQQLSERFIKLIRKNASQVLFGQQKHKTSYSKPC